jgi:hypothetical protein
MAPSRTATTLFDDIERHDRAASRNAEDSFTFLNRVDQPFWAEVRRALDEWFSRYPIEEAEHLREGFRSPLSSQHKAAWWELYLYELFTRLGYGITVHPQLGDSPKRPDFELRQDGRRLYVEAAVLFSGIVDDEPQLPPWFLDAVDGVANGDFLLGIADVSGAGSERLKVRQITAPLEGWLGGLDPDLILAALDRGAALPQYPFSERGWEVVFEAWPLSPDARSAPGHRVLGIGQTQAGYVDDIGQLRSKLKAKAGRYGRPEVPLLTAVLCEASFMKPDDIGQALYGRVAYRVPVERGQSAVAFRQRDGFWVRGDGPQNQRVSAVLTATQLHPANAPSVTPQLWLNPWANHPVEEGWPFPVGTVSEAGDVTEPQGEVDMHALLGLPEPWPGSDPFPGQSEDDCTARRPGGSSSSELHATHDVAAYRELHKLAVINLAIAIAYRPWRRRS